MTLSMLDYGAATSDRRLRVKYDKPIMAKAGWAVLAAGSSE